MGESLVNRSNAVEEEDWFGEFPMEESWTLQEPEENDTKMEPHFLDTASGRDVMHKRGLTLDMTRLIEIIYETADPFKHHLVNFFLLYFVLHTYGKRNIRKDAVSESQLNVSQNEVYQRIREEMKNPLRRQRISTFINQKDITKRLINYFVVHYSLMEREISYYLDKTSYPYKVIGEFNNPNQPEILARKSNGENIVWINFHQEYKNSKNKKGRRNRHAPYRRSISVQGADGNEYSLCELNFYIWLDDVGGFELFYLFETDIREKKSIYDEKKRLQENMVVMGKKKKKKIVLRNTDGRNYKTHLVQCTTQAPHSILQGNCSFTDYLSHIRSQRNMERKSMDPEPDNKRYKVDHTIKKKKQKKNPVLDFVS